MKPLPLFQVKEVGLQGLVLLDFQQLDGVHVCGGDLPQCKVILTESNHRHKFDGPNVDEGVEIEGLEDECLLLLSIEALVLPPKACACAGSRVLADLEGDPVAVVGEEESIMPQGFRAAFAVHSQRSERARVNGVEDSG